MAIGTFTMQTLQQQSGVSVRTLRHWIRNKLVPKPIGRGRGARYDDRHLIRARVVHNLRTSGMSLSAVRSRIASLSDDQLAQMLPPEPRPMTPEGVPVAPPSPTYPSETWEVVPLLDGLILMLNPNRGAVLRRIADEIYRYYAGPRAKSAATAETSASDRTRP